MPPQIDPTNPNLVILSDDAMVTLPNGSTVPARDVIGMQSDYTRKTTELALERKAMLAAQEQAQQAMDMVEGFNADPLGSLAEMRTRAAAWAEANGQEVPDWMRDTVQTPATPGQPAALAAGANPYASFERMLNERLGAIESTVNGFVGRADANAQVASLESKHPELYKDPAFREQVGAVVQRMPGASIEDAHKVAAYELQQLKIDSLQNEVKSARRDSIGSIPSLGFGNSTFGAKDSKSMVDETSALESIWNKLVDTELNQ
jgi:hypothetical protein